MWPKRLSTGLESPRNRSADRASMSTARDVDADRTSSMDARRSFGQGTGVNRAVESIDAAPVSTSSG